MTTGMGTELGVTVVTANAGQDSLTDADYREIYDEVRGFDAESGKYRVSLEVFVGLVQSEFTRAAWSNYHLGKMRLNRTMRSELRRAVGLPALPPSVAEAVAGVDEDATVVRVGDDDLVRRVVLVASGAPVTVRWNGAAAAWVGEETSPGKTKTAAELLQLVTPVTRARKGVFVPTGVFDRVNAVRQRRGLSWAQVLEAAEAALAGHGSSVVDAADADAVGAEVGQVLG